MLRQSLSLVVFAGLAGLTGAPAAAVGQQTRSSTPLFRSGVQLVLADVVVRDEKTGRIITGLTKDDFEIDDEGKPQAIASFASVDLPDVHTTAVHATTPWTVTDRIASNRREDGRLIAFFINDPFIPFDDTGYLRDLLHRFIHNEMADDDEVAVVPVTHQMPRQEFTSDRERLDAVSDRLQGTAGGIPVAPDQILTSLNDLLSGLATINGRRKVVIVLGGEVLSSAFVGTPLYEQTLRLAAAANTGIYPISLTGVRGLSVIVGSVAGSAQPQPLAMNILAHETGGVVANRNDIDKALKRVEEDAGSYYLIGFSPNVVDTKSGHLRRLTVRVRRRGAVVQARRGYMPLGPLSGASVPAALDEDTGDPIPDPEIPLRIQAGCFADSKDGPLVVVTLAVDAPRDQLNGHSLEYWVAGMNSSGHIVQTVRGASVIPLATSPLDVGVVAAIHVSAGLSMVKAIVRVNGRKGSVSLNVDVPRFEQPLAMSDIELAPMSEHAIVAGNPPAFLTQHLPKPVSVARAFDADDTLAIYGEVYAAEAPGAVTAVATVVDVSGRSLRRVTLPLSPVTRQALKRPSAATYSTQLALEGLAAGTYTLRVEAADTHGHTNAKGIPFEVKPSPSVRER
jgi:VWFA-related protein